MSKNNLLLYTVQYVNPNDNTTTNEIVVPVEEYNHIADTIEAGIYAVLDAEDENWYNNSDTGVVEWVITNRQFSNGTNIGNVAYTLKNITEI